MNINETLQCEHCLFQNETLGHMCFECPVVEPFWKDVIRWWNTKHSDNVNLNFFEILDGCKPESKSSYKLNHFFLLITIQILLTVHFYNITLLTITLRLMLHYFHTTSNTVLNTTLPHHFLHYYIATLLYYCIIALLHYYTATLLHYYTTTLIH